MCCTHCSVHPELLLALEAAVQWVRAAAAWQAGGAGSCAGWRYRLLCRDGQRAAGTCWSVQPASCGNGNVFQFVTHSPVSRLDYFCSVPHVHHLGKHADSTKHLIASPDFICKLESRGSGREKKPNKPRA